MAEPPYAVLVPYYSNPAYLRSALESVIAQSDPNWSCIVVDDSPDPEAAPAVVASLADGRITIERNATNLGVAGNFERCFELARSRGWPSAVILHADDELEPWYVATMVAEHTGDPSAACVIPRARVIGADGSPSRTLPDSVKRMLWPRTVRLEGEAGLRRLLHGQFFHCPAVSYRLASLPVPAWNQRWQQVMDLELFAELLLADRHFVLARRVCFRYRRHRHQQTEVNSIEVTRTVEESTLCNELADRADARGWGSAARAGRWRSTVRMQALVRAVALVAHGDVAQARASIALALRR